MFEALLHFIKEILFKNTTLDIRSQRFNLLAVLGRLLIIFSFFLNYYLIGKFIRIADKHYELEQKIVILEKKNKDCWIDFQSIDKK